MTVSDKSNQTNTKLDYYECYAKIVLEEILPDLFFNLAILDKPDLQNKFLNIGIEVTSAINNKQREIEGLYSNLHNKSSSKKRKMENRISLCGGKLDNQVLCGIPEHNGFQEIITVVDEKLKKLSSYTPFEKQYLFIFSSIYASLEMLEDALEELHKTCFFGGRNKFDGIFILVPGELYIFNLDLKNVRVEEIDDNRQRDQACRANDMSEIK